jgi:hypothetical protein
MLQNDPLSSVVDQKNYLFRSRSRLRKNIGSGSADAKSFGSDRDPGPDPQRRNLGTDHIVENTSSYDGEQRRGFAEIIVRLVALLTDQLAHKVYFLLFLVQI